MRAFEKAFGMDRLERIIGETQKKRNVSSCGLEGLYQSIPRSSSTILPMIVYHRQLCLSAADHARPEGQQVHL